MSINYVDLAAELTAGHPDQGAYSATNSVAADQLNAEGAYTSWARPAEGGIADMVKYLATHDSRSNEGGDTDASLILGRLNLVAQSEPYTDPFARAGVWEAGGSGSNLQIELDATNNKLVFGSAHDISSLNVKDSITLSGSTADDGTQQIVSISLQEVTVVSITVAETLERVFRVYKNQDAKQLTREQVQNAKAILTLLAAPSVDVIDFTNTEIDLAFQDMEDAEVWKAADTAALNAFSEGQQSRATELGFRRILERDVERARET